MSRPELPLFATEYVLGEKILKGQRTGGSPFFLLKLVLVTCLLANGAVLERTERALRLATGGPGLESRLWQRLRTTTYLSLLLWTCTVLAGTVLVNAA